MLIKALLILCLASINTVCFTYVPYNNDAGDSTNLQYLSVFPFSSGEVLTVKTFIQWNDVFISGIIIAKTTNDTVKAVFLNEFGIKAFEFEAIQGKCKLTNVMELIYKWYIRKTIEKDFAFIFSVVSAPETNIAEFDYHVSNQKTIYRYFFQHEKLFKLLRFEKKKPTAIIEIESDSSYIMKNSVKNITYNFKILKRDE